MTVQFFGLLHGFQKTVEAFLQAEALDWDLVRRLDRVRIDEEMAAEENLGCA